MCLGIPMEITEIRGDKGLAKCTGLKRWVNIQFLKELKVGDFVIVHAGFAIEKVDKKRAEETLNFVKIMKNEIYR